MNLDINYDKVKMKHYLQVRLEDDVSLDLDYALYEIMHVLKDRRWKNEKTIIQLTWGGFSYSVKGYTTQDIFDKLVETGKLKSEEKSGHIYYSVIDHPWQ